MSFASVGNLGTAQVKSLVAPNRIDITTLNTVPVGDLIAVITAWDNTSTTDTALNSFDRTLGCIDGFDNRYVCLASAVNGNGAAASGVQVAIYVCRVTTQLDAGEIIRVTSTSTRNARAISAWQFTMDSDYFCLAQNGRIYVYSDGTDPGACTLSGMASRPYLLLHALAAEGPNTDGYTWDADYTQFTGNGTTGGAGDSNMHIRGGFRMATLTGDTVDVTSTTADRDYAQALVAIFEYDHAAFPTNVAPPYLDDFNRAAEDPLSDGGLWEAANGAPLEVGSGADANTVTNDDTTSMQMSARTEDFTSDQEAYIQGFNIDGTAGRIFEVNLGLQDLGAGTVDGYGYRYVQQTAGDFGIELRLVKLQNGVEERMIGTFPTGTLPFGAVGMAAREWLGIRRVGHIIESWFGRAQGTPVGGGSLPDPGLWNICGAVEDDEFLGGQIGIGMQGTSYQGDNFSGGRTRRRRGQIIRYVYG